MVYTGLFPIDGDQYEPLKEALEKLSLNDPALVWEPENSHALGFGFRVGFLGLLHMEVIKERLEREFGLDLLATAPSRGVPRVPQDRRRDGERCTRPRRCPTLGDIDHIEEPYLKAKILIPPDYVGAVMDLTVASPRHVQVTMNYLSQHHGGDALGDSLCPSSSWTTSTSSRAEHERLRQPRLRVRRLQAVAPGQKLDILLSGKPIDALSFIVHKDKAYDRGRVLCEKLKEIIPRQMFEVPIQAAVGGRVLARQTVKRQAQGRAGEVLRRRYHPQAQAAREAEGRARSA